MIIVGLLAVLLLVWLVRKYIQARQFNQFQTFVCRSLRPRVLAHIEQSTMPDNEKAQAIAEIQTSLTATWLVGETLQLTQSLQTADTQVFSEAQIRRFLAHAAFVDSMQSKQQYNE